MAVLLTVLEKICHTLLYIRRNTLSRKTRHLTFDHSFGKYRPRSILEILSLSGYQICVIKSLQLTLSELKHSLLSENFEN